MSALPHTEQEDRRPASVLFWICVVYVLCSLVVVALVSVVVQFADDLFSRASRD